jgi:hypothetical protein
MLRELWGPNWMPVDRKELTDKIAKATAK